MDAAFEAAIQSLVPKFQELLSKPPARCLKDIPIELKRTGGIYLFSEGENHLYVGRTRRIRERYSDHTRLSSGVNSAPFAMLLAREATGIKRAYNGPLVRKRLLTHVEYGSAFRAAKERVRQMSFRYVVEENDARQLLLECYVAIALKTPHNDFGNH